MDCKEVYIKLKVIEYPINCLQYISIKINGLVISYGLVRSYLKIIEFFFEQNAFDD